MVYSRAIDILLIVAVLAVPTVLGDLWAYNLSLVYLYAIATLGVGLCWGQAGFLPLGQGMFLGLAAYMSGLGLIHVAGGVWGWLLVVPVVIVPGVLAFVIGLLIFRGRTESGPFFALITLAMTLLAFQIATAWNSVTGGFNGLRNIPDLAGMSDFTDRYYIAGVALILAVAFCMWLIEAPIGVVWRALSQNERRIAFFGYSTATLKAAAFGAAGLLAGFAGFLYAPQQNLVTPTLAGFVVSANLVIWAAVGGRGSAIGPALGAVLVGVLSTELRDGGGFGGGLEALWDFLARFWEAVVAGFFIIVVLFLPNGIAGLFAKLNASLKRLGRLPFRPILAPPVRTAGAAGPPALALSGCRVAAGEVRILNGLTLRLDRAAIYCLIGPNGAGKTSTFNTLSTELRMQEGEIRLDGEVISGAAADTLAAKGIGRKFQIPSVFPNLTIADNLHVALWGTRARLVSLLRPSLRRWDTPLLATLRERFPFLAQRDRIAGDLSHGERQVLELAMALAAEPRLLLLDEPCAGLSHEDTRQVIDAILWAREELGLTVLLIEHDMSLVREIADHVFVMHQGALLAEGDVAAVQADDKVREVYVGMAS